MSKLPPWRAATGHRAKASAHAQAAAAVSHRSRSLQAAIAKGRTAGGSASQPATASGSSSSSSSAGHADAGISAALALPGAVERPFYGPQPRNVALAVDEAATAAAMAAAAVERMADMMALAIASSPTASTSSRTSSPSSALLRTRLRAPIPIRASTVAASSRMVAASAGVHTWSSRDPYGINGGGQASGSGSTGGGASNASDHNGSVWGQMLGGSAGHHTSSTSSSSSLGDMGGAPMASGPNPIAALEAALLALGFQEPRSSSPSQSTLTRPLFASSSSTAWAERGGHAWSSHGAPHRHGPVHGPHMSASSASASPSSPSPSTTPSPQAQGKGNPPANASMQTTALDVGTSGSSASNSSSGSSSLSSAAATTSHSASSGGAPSDDAAAPRPTSWSAAFHLPPSRRAGDFTFEHGAYGIPKRHPLSAVVRSRTASAKGKEKAKAPKSMLAAAADFLVGGPGPSVVATPPVRGDEALLLSLQGGSTPDGREIDNPEAIVQRASEAVAAATDPSEDSYRHAAEPPHAVGPSRARLARDKSASVKGWGIRDKDGRIVPERLRSVQVGEDAYFLRPDSLGVADGVGGWASRKGADPALFSRLLMHFCAVELSRYDGLSASDLAADGGALLTAWASVDPVEVMHRAWERCVRASRREGIIGSSTALLALLRGDELRIANIGDCVLLIIRSGDLLFRSTEQQHSFNFPVQLGMMGDTAPRTPRGAAAGKAKAEATEQEDYDGVEDGDVSGAAASSTSSPSPPPTSDDPAGETGEWDEPRRDAGRWSIRVQRGDIIVVGSDGLMDNLFDEDILEEVLRFIIPPPAPEGEHVDVEQPPAQHAFPPGFSPQLVSEALCSRAKAVSEDSRAISSPFQQRAMEEGLNYVGGKHDDISVLVAVVGERDAPDGGLSIVPSQPEAVFAGHGEAHA